jgi:L-fuconate dehydratase
MVDYVRISASLDNRVAEYVDHLHEHFEHPPVVRDGAYMPPAAAGYGIAMKRESLESYAFPDGAVWRARRERKQPIGTRS